LSWSHLAILLGVLHCVTCRPKSEEAREARKLIEKELKENGLGDDEDLLKVASGSDYSAVSSDELDIDGLGGGKWRGVPGFDYSADGLHFNGLKVKSITPLGKAKGGSDFTAEETENIESVKSVDKLEDIQEIKNIDNVVDMKNLKSVLPIKSIEEIKNILPVKNIEKVKSISEVTSIEQIKDDIATEYIKKNGLVNLVGGAGHGSGAGEAEPPAVDLGGSGEGAEPTPVDGAESAVDHGYGAGAESEVNKLQSDIDEENEIESNIENAIKKEGDKVKALKKVYGDHENRKQEKIHKLGDLKKSIEEYLNKNVKSIKPIKNIEEVESIQPIKSLEEVESDTLLKSVTELKSVKPITSIKEVKQMYELTKEQADTLKKMIKQSKEKKKTSYT